MSVVDKGAILSGCAHNDLRYAAGALSGRLIPVRILTRSEFEMTVWGAKATRLLTQRGLLNGEFGRRSLGCGPRNWIPPDATLFGTIAPSSCGYLPCACLRIAAANSF